MERTLRVTGGDKGKCYSKTITRGEGSSINPGDSRGGICQESLRGKTQGNLALNSAFDGFLRGGGLTDRLSYYVLRKHHRAKRGRKRKRGLG